MPGDSGANVNYSATTLPFARTFAEPDAVAGTRESASTEKTVCD